MLSLLLAASRRFARARRPKMVVDTVKEMYGSKPDGYRASGMQ
jgi:hypothetical protein